MSGGAFGSPTGRPAETAAAGPAAASDAVQAWADAIALQACVYLLPLWEMARMRAATATRRDARGRFVDDDPGTTRRWVNTFIHARKLLGAGGSRVVTPNGDTLYTNAWLDLTRGPLVISVPDTADRYYVLGFLDFWTNPFAHVGRRTTGTGEGVFLVAGPEWAGTVPEGMRLLRAPTAHVWIIGRIMVEGPEDVPAVNALQDGFRMAPLADWLAGARDGMGEAFDTGIDPRAPREAARFLEVVSRALRENPPPQAERALLADFARLGLDGGLSPGIAPLPPEVAVPAIGRALATLGSLMDRADGDAGAGSVPRGGWTPPLRIGDSFSPDWLRRALVATKYIGALTSVEAMYPMAHVDSLGRPLSGAHRYTIRFEPGAEPPVDAFWSLTMYDSRDCMLVPNAIDRHRIGDRSRGLVREADGALVLRLQHASPGDALEPNWLPAPEGRFYLCLRAYQPRAALRDGDWMPPDIVRGD
jgi:hypothetical protein